MSHNGEFEFHISQVIKKVKQRCGWLHRSFTMNNIKFRRFMWRTYVLGIIDYGSQLWCPTKQSLITRLENLQRLYTANTYGISHEDYWTRLRLMKLTSIERRLQHYRIIYIWKAIEHLVSDFGLKMYTHPYKGRFIDIVYPKSKCTRAMTLWRQTLSANGGQLFNAMPQYIRDLTEVSIDTFKCNLDSYLETIPDCPLTSDLIPVPISPITNKNSNCLLDWTRYIGRHKEDFM